MKKNSNRLTCMAAAWLAIAVIGCGNESKRSGSEPVVSLPSPPSQPALEVDTPNDTVPDYLENCYGLETGDIGIEECDRWVKQASECAQASGEDDAFVVETKQKRLMWKLASRSASADEQKRTELREQCSTALDGLAAQLKEHGCSGTNE